MTLTWNCPFFYIYEKLSITDLLSLFEPLTLLYDEEQIAIIYQILLLIIIR